MILHMLETRSLYTRTQKSYKQSLAQLPKIVMLTTGGTIAGRWEESQGGVVPVLSGNELLALTPGLGELAEFEVDPIANSPCLKSKTCSPENVLILQLNYGDGHT